MTTQEVNERIEARLIGLTMSPPSAGTVGLAQLQVTLRGPELVVTYPLMFPILRNFPPPDQIGDAMMHAVPHPFRRAWRQSGYHAHRSKWIASALPAKWIEEFLIHFGSAINKMVTALIEKQTAENEYAATTHRKSPQNWN